MRINLTNFFLGLYILFFLPINFSLASTYNELMTVLRISLGCISLIYCLIFPWKKHYELAIFILYCGGYLLSDALSEGIAVELFLIDIYPIGFFSTTLYYTIKLPQNMIDTLYNLSIFLIIIHYIYCVFYLVLGIGMPMIADNHNGIQTYMTFCIGGILLHQDFKQQEWRKRDIVFLCVAAFAMFTSMSATGVLACLVGIFVFFAYRVLKGWEIICGYLGVFFSIIVLNKIDLPIVQMILNYFNKSETFTNRAWRWAFAWNEFKEHIWRGASALNKEASAYAGYYMDYFNPHNALLSILVFSGILGFFFISWLFIKVIRIKERWFLVTLSMIMTTGLMETNLLPSSFVFVVFLAVAIGLCNKRDLRLT